MELLRCIIIGGIFGPLVVGQVERVAGQTDVPQRNFEVAFFQQATDANSAKSTSYRPADQRPLHDDQQLAAAGIRRFESPRLKLYTDIDPEIAQTLPAVVDQLYDALVAYFGPLPPDKAGTEFQMTGYLMRDETLFREQGLLKDVTTVLHGLHRQNRFWMREQKEDYFRRHLLLHECTHCYMTFVPGPIPPVWYMEGMAELFGTHRQHPDGRIEFRILPTKTDDVQGWGRIETVRKECAEQRALSLSEVHQLPLDRFFQPIAYSWSWALCQFLDSHPRYRDRFRQLGEHLHDGQFVSAYQNVFRTDQAALDLEWLLFEAQLQSGYDTVRAAIEWQPLQSWDDKSNRTMTVQAARGWQDTGFRVSINEEWEFQAQGRFTLAQQPKPWISEPQGISVRYFEGKPLGRLLAGVIAERDPKIDSGDWKPQLHVEAIGKAAKWKVPLSGRLLFRLNDDWDSLSDNTGSVDVTFGPVRKTSE